jgi:hypothetical protein
MERRQRLTLLGVAAAIAVAAVVIALVVGGDDGDDNTTQTTAAQTETGGTTTTGTQPDTATTETAPPEPEPTQIRLKGGEPVGGVEKVEVEKDDRLEIEVTSDQELPIHFHGYDIEKDAGPDKPGVFKLKADIEGVFEIEVESTGTQIAEVTVKP